MTHRTAIGPLLLSLSLLVLSGCATQRAPDPLAADAPEAVRACRDWYAQADAAVRLAGVRDAGSTRIAGFAQLRADRLHASFAADPRLEGDAGWQAWTSGMARLDLEARRAEFSNLPAAARAALVPVGASGSADALLAEAHRCAALLGTHDAARPDRRAALRARARVPDDYVDWQRTVGLYAVTRAAFSAGIARWHRETLADFAAAPMDANQVVRYDAAAGAPAPLPGLQADVAGAPRDALGVPQFTPQLLERLFDTHAPVFEVGTRGLADRIGAVRWGPDGQLRVDGDQPAVYRRLAWTRIGADVLPQLVYTVWFPERPASGAFDLLAGKLDGLAWRVTLDARGALLLADSIHPCGCYHLFFPTPRAIPRPSPVADEEWAFSPASLPAGTTRVVLRVAPGTHYLSGVTPLAGAPAPGAIRLEARHEDSLRSLPLGIASPEPRRSLYGEDGLVAASARPEAAFFWPMGIPSAGAMRQWGRHATAFVGRRHFDDADLVERRFSITP
jgi:hypothetical protein